MTSTNRREAYDGLEWRLDARVASRASLVEAEAKYLLKLGRVGRGGARGKEDDDARGDGLSDAQGDVARGGNRARSVHGGARGPFGQVRATTKGVSERAGRARARFDHRLYL